MNVNKDATYLGDGVYVRHDGYHVVLITDTSTIYLDPHVLAALGAYVEKLNKEDSMTKLAITAKADCEICHGVGVVEDWIGHGFTSTLEQSTCDCVIEQLPDDYDYDAGYKIIPAGGAYQEGKECGMKHEIRITVT